MAERIVKNYVIPIEQMPDGERPFNIYEIPELSKILQEISVISLKKYNVTFQRKKRKP